MSDASNRPDNLHLRLNVLLGAGILLSALVIWAAASGDLWLDEIWSIFFAEAAKSPWEIVSLYKHDNNHLLNTFYLYAIGRQDTLIIYRLFSMAAGIGSLYLLTRIARKRGDLESIFVLLLAGFSYPLILYFTEARGYGPAMFFALLSWLLLEECSANCSTTRLIFFWSSLCLGLMSHLSFVVVFLSLSVSILIREVFITSSLKSKIWNCFKYLFFPSLFLISVYLYYARGMTIGGGDVNNPFAEISRGIAYLLGLPGSALFWRMAAYGIFAAITLTGAYLCYREKDILWSFFIAVLIFPPIVIILVTRPTIYYFRYLVVTYPFFYLLLSFILGRLYRSGRKGSYVVLTILCFYLVIQTQQLLPLLRDGRGNYRAILAEISTKSSGNVLKIGSDHDFRNKMLLSFYARFLPPQKSVHYIEQPRWNLEPPEWFILHSIGHSVEPDPFVGISEQRIYKLMKREKSAGNSGFSWFLYHEVSPGLASGRGSQ